MKRSYEILTLLALVLFSFNVNAQGGQNSRVVATPVGNNCGTYDVELIVTSITWNVNGEHHVHVDFNRPSDFNYNNTTQTYTCKISTTLYGVADLPVKFFYETSPNERVETITNAQGKLIGFRVFPTNPDVGGVTTTANMEGNVGWTYDGSSACVGVQSYNRAGANCNLPGQVHYYCGGTNEIDLPDMRLAQTTGQEIHTYPNPVQDRLFVETNTLDVKQINVMNLQGQILNDKVSIRYGVDRAQINTAQLETGIYLIAIETPNGITVEKVMVQKR